MEIEKTLWMNTLFAFYEPLLTEKQQEYLTLYYADDYSLGEIAEAFDVSRQAVYDNIQRSEIILLDYEEKLHLVEDFRERQKKMQQLEEYIDAHHNDDAQLAKLIKQITQESKREGN